MINWDYFGLKNPEYISDFLKLCHEFLYREVTDLNYTKSVFESMNVIHFRYDKCWKTSILCYIKAEVRKLAL